MSGPRTWTLVGQGPDNTPLFSGSLADGEEVHVIELVPVLNLLMRLYNLPIWGGNNLDVDDALHDLRDLLKGHGHP